MRRLTRASVVVLGAALLSAGRPAVAADPRTETAREHSQQGDSYYKLEKYTNAIGEYEQAYLAKPDPSFLYNIAQCHRLMGHGAEAIKFYRRFLKDAPSAPNRAVAEKHIKDLEDAGARQPAAPVEPPSTAPPPGSPPPAAVAPPPSLVSPPPTALAPPPAALAPSPEPSATPSPLSPPPPPAASSTATVTPALELNPPPPTSTPVVETPINENGASPSPTDSHPFYTRWWFWTAVGVVVLGGVIVAAAAKHDPTCPAGYKCN